MSRIVILCFLLAAPFQLWASERSYSENEMNSMSPKVHPAIGLELSASTSGLGNQTYASGSKANFNVLPLSLQIDYQPFHNFGVVGIGPSFEYDSISALSPTTGGQTSLMYGWSLGGQVRYQARFSEFQPVVPIAAYSLGVWNYKSAFVAPGSFAVYGPTVGLWIYLNYIDRATSTRFFQDLGVSRTYLIIEMRNQTGSDDVFALSGHSFHIGVRFEI